MTGMLTVTCPDCGQHIELEKALAGKQSITCKCGDRWYLPTQKYPVYGRVSGYDPENPERGLA